MFNPLGKQEKGALAKDVREMNEFLQANGKMGEMRALGRPSLIQTFLAISSDWALVVASVCLVHFYSLWWTPIALLVIGSRQRALVVLTHDASHFLLAQNRYINDVIANLFLCFPMLKSLKYYRAVHLPHHMNLGDEHNDTDYLHDPEAMKKGWVHVYLKYLLSYDFWVISELKQTFSKISGRHILLLSVWWATVLCGLAAVVSISYAATFFALWFISRAIMYHVITNFIIISDHHGLFPGTILEYTRNHPSSGFVRWFIHPHNNGFHLAHHLAPFIPFYNLDKARKLLQGWDRYDRADQCETYFIGEKSVVRSWGKCVASDLDTPAIATAYDAQPAFDALEAIMQEVSTVGEQKTAHADSQDRRVA
jgi:fatty acid desaturase